MLRVNRFVGRLIDHNLGLHAPGDALQFFAELRGVDLAVVEVLNQLGGILLC